jgi:hypothetical protein
MREGIPHTAIYLAIVWIQVDVLREIFYRFRIVLQVTKVNLADSFINTEVIGRNVCSFFKVVYGFLVFPVSCLSLRQGLEKQSTFLKLLCFLKMNLCLASFALRQVSYCYHAFDFTFFVPETSNHAIATDLFL